MAKKPAKAPAKKKTQRKKQPTTPVYFHPDNRILKIIKSAGFRKKATRKEAFQASDYKAVELAPAFRAVHAEDPKNALQLAETYATAIADAKSQREFFQGVAQMENTERQTVIKGYRKANQARGVIHAIGQLPRQQGRLLMNDFLRNEDGQRDKKATSDVLHWLREAGGEIRRLEKGTKLPDGEFDEAVVEFFEDVADAISEAVTAVVDAFKDAIEAIGEALLDIVTWVAEQVADLARALLAAGETILSIVSAALVAGYEIVKKMVKALEEIGKAMFEILEEVFELAVDALVTVLRAIDQLTRQLAELLSWLATKTFEIVRKGVEALLEIGKSIGNILYQALEFGYTLIRNTVEALVAIGKTLVEIMVAAVTRPASLWDEIVRSFRDLGRDLRSMFDEVVAAGEDLVYEIARSAARIGATVAEFAEYMADAALETVTKIVDALKSAGRTIREMVISIAEIAVEHVKKIVQAAFALGESLLNILKEVFDITVNLLQEVVKAAFELGKTIVEFTQSMVAFTYRTAARLIDAALAVGQAAADILEAVAGASYYVFRKIINGVLQALGPVGDVFEWLLDRGEALASDLWREAVLAIRYVKESVTEVLDWAAAQTDAIFDRILFIIEDIGSALYTVIEWAETAGETALELLGEATVRVGNSVTYVFNYLERDFLPGLAKFVEGVMNAGYALVDLALWTVGRGLEVMKETVRGALAAGATIATFLVALMTDPANALDHFLQAVRELGNTLTDVFQAAIIDTAEEFLEEVVQTLMVIGEQVLQMLAAVLEVAGGAIGTVIGILFQMLGDYRLLTAEEIADAREVFGDSLNYDDIYLARPGNVDFNDIVFPVQDFFTQLFAGNWSGLTDERDSRAFVTLNLINIDVDDDNFDRPTLIHELTHVWQNQHVGPAYLSHAIATQIADGVVGWDFGADALEAFGITADPDEHGYNYGYQENLPGVTISDVNFDGTDGVRDPGSYLGIGGEPELNAAAGNLSEFSPEQQGQIAQQYFVRKVLETQAATDYAPWQVYAEAFQDGMPARAIAA